MERNRLFLTLVLVLASVPGCAKSEGDVADGSSAASSAAAEPAIGPDRVVGEFMEAFKNGNDDVAAKLLTEKARAEAARTGKAISPPGSKTMTYKVGEVEYKGEKTGAHVACTITDTDPDGQTLVYNVIWVLRNEAAAWRVAGVIMKVFDDGPPVAYDFEDQDEMDRQMQAIEQEMTQRAIETLQATQPADAGTRTQ